jgi:hypothetical protein
VVLEGALMAVKFVRGNKKCRPFIRKMKPYFAAVLKENPRTIRELNGFANKQAFNSAYNDEEFYDIVFNLQRAGSYLNNWDEEQILHDYNVLEGLVEED